MASFDLRYENTSYIGIKSDVFSKIKDSNLVKNKNVRILVLTHLLATHIEY